MRNTEEINEELMRFLDESPNSFFAVKNAGRMLEEDGYVRLFEGCPWEIKAGGKYYVTRNGSALIAFRLPEGDPAGFQIMSSHCDSPAFKIKPSAEITVERQYVKLNVEKYGGMLCAPWFDRPLSAAGRVVVRTEKGVETRLINIDRDLMIIPSLCIHFNRTANDGFSYNAQRDMLPLLGAPETVPAKFSPFLSLIASEAGCAPEDVLDTDLYLYVRQKACRIGIHGEYIGSGRLDDLQCAFASLRGLLDSRPSGSIAVCCILDNEEVGSGTKQGAASSFLKDTLMRISRALGRTEDEYLQALTSSFCVSADNAHAVHPNWPDKADPTSRPYMNRGIVIKYAGNQKYTTDAVSGAIFRSICGRAGVPVQSFANRSDVPGGSTLGNISTSQVAVNTVDIGLPQLAMHSAFETAGAADTAWLAAAAAELFSCSVCGTGDGNYTIIR